MTVHWQPTQHLVLTWLARMSFKKHFPIPLCQTNQQKLSWRNISVTGSIKDSKHSGQHLVLSDGNVDNIHHILSHSPRKSMTDLSHWSRSSHRSVQRLYTAHKANSTLLMMHNSCGDHITSHKLWPPWSPDVTPWNFYHWEFLKENMYKNRLHPLEELKENTHLYIQVSLKKLFTGCIRHEEKSEHTHALLSMLCTSKT
jgi:hypothetical protein